MQAGNEPAACGLSLELFNLFHPLLLLCAAWSESGIMNAAMPMSLFPMYRAWPPPLPTAAPMIPVRGVIRAQD